MQSATIPIARYDGNGVATNFSFPHFFADDSEIIAIHTDSNGTNTILTITTDYAVNGAGTATGSIDFPEVGSAFSTLATNEQITLYRETEFSQLAAFVNNTTRFASIESGLDKLTRIVQELQEQLNRAPLVNVTSTDAPPDVTALTTAYNAVIAQGIYGTRTVSLNVVNHDISLSVSDGLGYYIVPSELDGMDLVECHAHVFTVSSSGIPTFQIHNLTNAEDVLSTKLTVDVGEKDSLTAATAAVINPTKNNVAHGDELRFDCDIAGTGTEGWQIRLKFQTP